MGRTTRRRHTATNFGRVLTAAAFALSLFVATTFPANAFSTDVAQITFASTKDPGSQKLTSAGAGVVTVARDTATATSEDELRKQAQLDPAGVLVSNSSGPIQWPFPGDTPISDAFGARSAPCSGCSSNHKGLDMTPGGGTPIGAIADGVVRSAEESDVGFGVNVVVDHRVNGERFTSLYAHMQFGSLAVTAGQPIKVGQLIGRVGTTGASTGNHLHLEIWGPADEPFDPYSWLRARVK